MLDLILDHAVYVAMESGQGNYFQLSGEIFLPANCTVFAFNAK